MIHSADIYSNNSVLETDICIIGSGPAGITLALELKATNKNITVLTGGIDFESIENQDLNKGIVSPEGSHESLEENRRRAFGGSSIVWGGRCIPFDDIDFLQRSWIPDSGWPFSSKDLEPYYSRAVEYCQIGDNNFNSTSVFNDSQNEIIPNFDSEYILSTKLERWSTPVNFAKDYYKVLNSQTNIEVLLDTHLLEIKTENNKDSISSLLVSYGQNKFIIKAKYYILACGGIENPRLLLASKNKFHPNGIGNANDIVGRYYMAHLNGIFMELSPNDRQSIKFDFEIDKYGVYTRRRWWITDKAQTHYKIGNCIFFLHGINNQDGHRDPLFSVIYISKFLISIIKGRSFKNAVHKWNNSKKPILDHCKVILEGGWKYLPQIISIARKRAQKRRLPFVLPSVSSKKLGLYFQAEQVPNYESRILLSDCEFDSHNMPRAIAQIKFDDLDKKTIIEAHNIFFKRYIDRSIGEIKCDQEMLLDFIDNRIKNFNSAAHHIGTTRISNDPLKGVVDENCRVHGIDNLYIAGSSVFPTGGHVNPTFSIIALTIKLADHIKTHL